MQPSDQRERAVDADSVAADLLGDDDSPGEGADRSRESDSSRLGRLFSTRTFAVALALAAVGVFVGGAIPLLGAIGRFVGLFAAAFVVGLLSSRNRYVEVGLAGALASGLGFVASALGSVLFPFAVNLLAEYGVAVAGVGAGTGLLASVVGHYFGRDLRRGLTRDV